MADLITVDPSETPGILNSGQLRTITGYQRDGDIKKHLERQGIPCFEGRSGVWTTMELVKIAGMYKLGLVKPGSANNDEVYL